MKILVIGLDAATMDLVKPWVDAGHLPELARLMSEGSYTNLLSTPNMHSASAWTSILTGVNPGRHGLYVFSDRDFKTGQQVFFKGGDRNADLITEHLAKQGLTSGMLNVPMTYPAEGSGGNFMISGLDAPSLNGNCFSPAELRDELLAVVPAYHFTPKGLGDLMSAGRVGEAVQAWMSLIENQTLAAEYLLEKYHPDFFMTVYTASDWGGHNLWKYADPQHPEYDVNSPHSDSLLSIYQALDRAITRLLRFANEATQVYVISDHGMGLHSGASYHLADWLESRGYMRRTKPAEKRSSLLSASRRAAKTILPAKLKEKIKSSLGDERIKQLQAAEKDTFYSSIDWAQTSAYTEAGRHVININLEGRNQNGSVAQEKYAEVCGRIIADLLAWKDRSGNTVVERVTRRDEVYRGDFAMRASDLYVYWNRAAHMGEPPRAVKAKGFWWSGDHRPEGILICKGKGIRAQQALNVPNVPQVYDLVPTILHLAELAVPEGLDGRVLEEICADRSAIRFAEAHQEAGAQPQTLSAEEEKLIEEKLRALGYL
jgi:predicted AlkP superfamily phosphohydrolase/phosphomutase